MSCAMGAQHARVPSRVIAPPATISTIVYGCGRREPSAWPLIDARHHDPVFPDNPLCRLPRRDDDHSNGRMFSRLSCATGTSGAAGSIQCSSAISACAVIVPVTCTTYTIASTT